MLTVSLALLGTLAATPATSPTLAVVNGVVIDRALVALEVSQEPAARYHLIPLEKRPKYESAALERLIDRELLLAEAARRALVPDAAAVAAHIGDAEKQSGGEKQLDAALQANGLTREAYAGWVRRRLAADKVRASVAEAARPTDAQIEAYYASRVTEFVKPEAARVEMVYFPLMPFATTQETAKALARANEAAAALRDGRAPKSVTATTGSKYVDMGTVHRGSAVTGVDEAIWAAAPNSVTGPVKSIYGYHVLSVGAKTAPTPLTLSDVRGVITETLQEKYAEEAFQHLIEALRKQAKIVRSNGGGQ